MQCIKVLLIIIVFAHNNAFSSNIQTLNEFKERARHLEDAAIYQKFFIRETLSYLALRYEEIINKLPTEQQKLLKAAISDFGNKWAKVLDNPSEPFCQALINSRIELERVIDLCNQSLGDEGATNLQMSPICAK